MKCHIKKETRKFTCICGPQTMPDISFGYPAPLSRDMIDLSDDISSIRLRFADILTYVYIGVGMEQAK